MTVKIGLPTNWQTLLGGLLGGIPPIIIAAAMTSHFTLSPTWMFVLTALSGLGTLIVGLTAKDHDVHSTAAEVQAATANVEKGLPPKV